MSNKRLKDHLLQYYRDQSLPPETTEWLIELAQRSVPEKERTMMKPMVVWWFRALAGLAAAAALFMVGAGIYFIQAGQSLQAGYPSAHAGNTGEVELMRNTAGSVQPKILAVRIHADWCKRNPVVTPIFTDLTSKYGNQPVLFVTLDITDETRRKQARYLASDLGIDWVFDKPFESGMIKLIDREHRKVLSILTDTQHRSKMEVLLAKVLPQSS